MLSTNALVASMKGEFPVTRLRADFSKSEASSYLNMPLSNNVLYGALERKYYQCADMLFLFIAICVGRVAGHDYEPI